MHGTQPFWLHPTLVMVCCQSMRIRFSDFYLKYLAFGFKQIMVFHWSLKLSQRHVRGRHQVWEMRYWCRNKTNLDIDEIVASHIRVVNRPYWLNMQCCPQPPRKCLESKKARGFGFFCGIQLLQVSGERLEDHSYSLWNFILSVIIMF